METASADALLAAVRKIPPLTRPGCFTARMRFRGGATPGSALWTAGRFGIPPLPTAYTFRPARGLHAISCLQVFSLLQVLVRVRLQILVCLQILVRLQDPACPQVPVRPAGFPSAPQVFPPAMKKPHPKVRLLCCYRWRPLMTSFTQKRESGMQHSRASQNAFMS